MSESESLQGRMVTSAEVAALLNVSRLTVERWRFGGYGPRPYRLGRKTVRYDRAEVEGWQAEQRE